MNKLVFSFASGVLFSIGLWLSDMVNPNRVIAFLDIFGAWDPALMFVMASALIVAVPGFYYLKKKQVTLQNEAMSFPTNTKVDKKLLIGSALFGIGWGLIGLCPGPAISVLPVAFGEIALFVVAMLSGIFIARRLPK